MRSVTNAIFGLLLVVCADAMAQTTWNVGGNDLAKSGARIGANTNVDVVFETDNTVRGRISRGGLWAFGTFAPSARVHVGSTAGVDALKVQVDGTPRLLVAGTGGTTIGGTTVAPANGLVVVGNAGVGEAPGSYKFKVTHGTFGMNIENVTTKDDWEFWSNSGGLSIYANGSFRGNFNPTSGAYTAISDERVKMNIEPMPSVLDKVNQLQPSTYQFHQDGLMADPTVAYGFMAQDVAMVFPHMVRYHVDHERGVDAYTMDYTGFGVLAIKAIQEMQQNIDALESRVVELESMLGGR